MYLELRGRDGDSTVVISFHRWTADFTFEVTWDAPSTRPVFESSVSSPAMLSRVASPFVDIDDALYGMTPVSEMTPDFSSAATMPRHGPESETRTVSRCRSGTLESTGNVGVATRAPDRSSTIK